MNITNITGYQPLDFQIMNSSQDADKIIALFKAAIEEGFEPNEVEQEVYKAAGVNPESLTWYDKERIQSEVELFYLATH